MQTKKLTRLIAAAEKYAEAAKAVRDTRREQPAGLYRTWPREYIARAAEALHQCGLAKQELVAAAKVFTKPKRKEKHVLRTS